MIDIEEAYQKALAVKDIAHCKCGWAFKGNSCGVCNENGGRNDFLCTPEYCMKELKAEDEAWYNELVTAEQSDVLYDYLYPRSK